MSNGTDSLVYLGDLAPAGPIKASDSTFWCDSAACTAGVDLKRVSSSQIASFVLTQMTVAVPLSMVGGLLMLNFDPATLAVVNGKLTVIGGGGTPPPSGSGAPVTGGGGPIAGGGGGVLTGGGTGGAAATGSGVPAVGGGDAPVTGGAGAPIVGGGQEAALLQRISELEARLAALEEME